MDAMTPVDPKGLLKHVRFLVLVAGLGACIQSLVWIGFTIASIVIYTQCNSKPVTNVDAFTYGNLVRTMYFTEPSCIASLDYLYMKPAQLLIWECVVLALMVLWFLSSILLIGGVKNKELGPPSIAFLTLWSILTIAISCIDLAMAVIFGLDIESVRAGEAGLGGFPSAVVKNIVLNTMSTISGFMMTIALRGFVLWVLNVAASIYFICCAVDIANAHNAKKEPEHSIMSRGPLNAFDSNIEQRSTHWLADAESMDRPKLQNNQYGNRNLGNQGEVNNGYMPNENSASARYQQQQPLASIMKKSFNDRPPSKSKEYNIPSPDYSPPPAQKPYRQDSYYGNNQNPPYRR